MESVKQAVLSAVLLIIAVWGQAEAAPEVQFSLRYYNKEIYTNDPDQAILLQVGLRNQGTSPVWFSLPSQPVFQLALTVLPAGSTGLALPPADKFNENRFFGNVAVAVIHGHFKIGNGGFAAAAIKQNFPVFINQSFIPILL